MSLHRRDFLRLAGLVAASATVSACTQLDRLGARAFDQLAGGSPPIGQWPAGDAPLFAALSRLTFGPRADERQRAAAMGLPAWIEEQLAPESIDDGALDLRLSRLDTLRMKADALYDLSNKLFDNEDRQTVPAELRRATLLRQVYSRRQLNEVMVEFWTDHFNISTDKGDCFYLKTVDDREVIRRHALGRFRDLLQASAHSPAMLVYLDQHVSDKNHPNENYAREVMELHTLGVDGGYTQQDVMELARCLTGWTVKERFWRGEFTFDADRHDRGPKTVLGLTIEPGGQGEAEQVLDALAAHPSTARYLAGKLALRFLGPDAPAELIARAAQTFTQTGGDIRRVLRALLLDGLALTQPKFKRPVNFIVSALRGLNAYTDGSEPLHDLLAQMGQPYFRWPTPDGYPDRAETWRGNLLPRWQFALRLAQNQIAGTLIDLPALIQAAQIDSPAALIDQLGGLLLGLPLPAERREALLASLTAEGVGDDLPFVAAAGLVASPAFQWR